MSMTSTISKKIVVSENSTGRVEKVICSSCNEEAGVNDNKCLYCGSEFMKGVYNDKWSRK